MTSVRIRRSFVVSLVGVLALSVGCDNQTGGGGGGASTNENSINDNSVNDNNVNDNNVNDNNVDNTNDSGTEPQAPQGGLVAGRAATAAFDSVPAAAFAQAKAKLHVFYGRTSHGSQLVTGMNMLDTGAGSLDLEEDSADLGHEGDTGWAETTRNRLDRQGSNINVVVWSWCGGVSDNTQAGIDTYLTTMSRLEEDYPGVVFVYMTGHLDGSGQAGNLNARNDQIRDYCRAHGKVLFDFAEIESYDPDGNYYPDESDGCAWCATWCTSHECPTGNCVNDSDCAHSHCFNCYQKGRAFWWLLARLAGWEGE